MKARRLNNSLGLGVLGAGLATIAVLLTACEAVIGADFGDTTTIACKHAAPPPRPTVKQVDVGRVDEVLVAITSVDFGDHKLPDGTPDPQRVYRTIGFDLDHSCSNQGRRPSCTPFDWSLPDVTDGVDGIDNSGGALMHAETNVFGIAPFGSTAITEGIRKGTIAPLGIVRIRGYNLRVVDDDVELDWYVAQPKSANTADPTPHLNGADAWPIWDGNIDGPAPTGAADYPISRFRDPHAYVSDYKLVATLPKGTPVKIQNVSFPTEGLTVMLTLSYDPTLRVLSGVIGGHLQSAELFRKLPRVTKEFGIGTLCKTDVSYPRIKTYFCAFVESHADGRDEPDAPCDALSLGMAIETTKVKPGVALPDPPFTGCPAESDPGTDSCVVPAPPN